VYKEESLNINGISSPDSACFTFHCRAGFIG